MFVVPLSHPRGRIDLVELMGEVFDHPTGHPKTGPAASSLADDAVSALHNAIGKSSQEMR